MGEVTSFPANLDFNVHDYFLGIRIQDNQEMTPRKQISGSLFALSAINAQNLQGKTIGESEGNIPLISTNGQLDSTLIPKIKKLGTVTAGIWEGNQIDSEYLDDDLTNKTINGLTIKTDRTRTLTVNSNVTLDQDLSTTSSPTFASLTLTDSAGLLSADSLDFSDFKDTLTLDADTTINTNSHSLTIDGALSATSLNINGSASLGTAGQNITFNSSLIPSTDGLNLGSSSNHWANLYVDNMSIGATDINGTSSEYFIINTDNADDEDMGLRFYLGPTLNTYGGLFYHTATDNFSLYRRENDATLGTLNLGGLSVGVSALYVDPASGNVGIGTTNPGDLLMLNPDSAGEGVSMTESDSTGNLAVRLRSFSTYGNMILYKNSSVNDGISLSGSGDSWINGGNIGIGTTSPGSKLVVSGTNANSIIEIDVATADADSYIKFSDGGSGIFSVGRDNTDNSFRIANGAVLGTNDRFVVQAAGNVGIGTTSPGAKLHISSDLGTASGGIRLSSKTYPAYYGGMSYTATGAGGINFALSHATSYWSFNNGNVGIGTTAPSQKLDIAGAINIQDGYTLRFNNSSNISILGSSSTGLTSTGIEQHFRAYDGVSTYAEYMTIKSGGNVGIGTTAPGYALEVVGNIYASGDITCGGSCGGGSSLWNENGSAIYYSTGNVGIGTTSPSSKLTVAGNVIVVGDTNNGSTYPLILKDSDETNIFTINSNGRITGNDIESGDTTKYNTSLGLSALKNASVGSYNTAVGYQSMDDATGNRNTAVGYTAGGSITTGSDNVAIGNDAMRNLLSNSYNVAVGSGAFSQGGSFEYGVAIGNSSQYSTTSGTRNVSVGALSLDKNTTGSYNVVIGHVAARYQKDGSNYLTTPENSIYIGASAKSGSDPAGGEDDITNEIVIGYNAVGNGANSVTLGNTSITKTILSGNVGIGTTAPAQKLEVAGRIRMSTWTADGDTAVYYNSSTGDIGVTASDERLKKNIATIPNALSIIQGIRGVTFNWKDDEMSKDTSVGVIAQEVAEMMPELTFPITGSDGKEYLGVHYDKLSPVLIQAMNEQQLQIQNQELRIMNQEDSVIGNQSLVISNQESIEKLTSQLKNHQEELETLSQTVATLIESNTTVTEVLTNHEARITALENSLISNQPSVIDELPNTDFQALDNRLSVLELEAGQYLFDLDGNLKVKQLEAETVVAGEIDIDENENMAGQAVLEEGEIEVRINTNRIENDSRVFVTPKGKNPVNWIISEQSKGEYFTIKLSEPADEEVKFDWWIIN